MYNIGSEEVQNVIKIQRKRIREKIPFPKNDFSSITRIDFMISILYSAYWLLIEDNRSDWQKGKIRKIWKNRQYSLTTNFSDWHCYIILILNEFHNRFHFSRINIHIYKNMNDIFKFELIWNKKRVRFWI